MYQIGYKIIDKKCQFPILEKSRDWSQSSWAALRIQYILSKHMHIQLLFPNTETDKLL